MILREPDIEQFCKKLKQEDRDDFREAYDEALGQTEPEDHISTAESAMYRALDADELITAASSGFHQDSSAPGSTSGFKFSSVNPLIEVKFSGADILLVRDREFSRVQFCVISTEVGDEDMMSWVENINTIYELFEDDANQKRLLEQNDVEDQQLDAIQYVTLLRDQDYDKDEIPFSVINKECKPDNYAIWTMDEPELCYVAGELIHKDLMDVIENCFDYAAATENPIEYSLRSEPLTPLQNVIYRIVFKKDNLMGKKQPLEFTRAEFREAYLNKLDLATPEDQREKLVKPKVSQILQVGLDIGILSKSNSDLKALRNRATDGMEDTAYRVMYRGDDDAAEAETAVWEKYKEAAAEVKMKWSAFEKAQADFETVQSGFEDFANDGGLNF